MILIRNISITILSLTFLLQACKHQPHPNTLKPFSSDGCSLFPDRYLINSKDWCACCFKHDIAYWQGGTKEQRAQADIVLRDCVLEKTGDNALAILMYKGVQAGGSPYFYNWYRWGYGWDYQRKYQELTAIEIADVGVKLENYYKLNNDRVCK